MKRAVSDDDIRDDDDRGKRFRGGSRGSEIRMLVPSRNAGAVIGKGGANIKRLRQDFSATIILPDTNSPERLLIIAGDCRTICDVLLDLIPLLEERRGGENEECEIRFLIHQSQAGAIIGRGGNKVKEMREETGAHIKVYTECAPMSTERVVQINGAPRVIVNCFEAIFEILQASPPKGPNRQYDPCNWEEDFVAEYGGYPGRESFGGGRGGRGSGRMSDFRGSRGPPPPPMRRGRDDYGSDRRRRSSGGYGDRGDSYDRGGGYDGGYRGSSSSRQSTSTSQVSIPKDLAGLIIGKGGARIKEIRQQSGASVSIADPDDDCDDRIITIVGTNDQIHCAQYLLQMSVKQRRERD
jgi:heterogeneous nuclear ribonucleoprotein K